MPSDTAPYPRELRRRPAVRGVSRQRECNFRMLSVDAYDDRIGDDVERFRGCDASRASRSIPVTEFITGIDLVKRNCALRPAKNSPASSPIRSSCVAIPSSAASMLSILRSSLPLLGKLPRTTCRAATESAWIRRNMPRALCLRTTIR